MLLCFLAFFPFCVTSYFGIIDKFNLKLIPEFDGSLTVPFIVRWFEKAECICKLSKIKEPTLIITLRLTKAAYAMYRQLGNDVDLEEIKKALYAAFGIDSFIT